MTNLYDDLSNHTGAPAYMFPSDPLGGSGVEYVFTPLQNTSWSIPDNLFEHITSTNDWTRLLTKSGKEYAYRTWNVGERKRVIQSKP